MGGGEGSCRRVRSTELAGFSIPTGLRLSAPGWPEARGQTRGFRPQDSPTPTGLRHLGPVFRLTSNQNREWVPFFFAVGWHEPRPLQGRNQIRGPNPRVSPDKPAQPGAGGRNPVGILSRDGVFGWACRCWSQESRHPPTMIPDRAGHDHAWVAPPLNGGGTFLSPCLPVSWACDDRSHAPALIHAS